VNDRVVPFGEGALLVELEQRIDPHVAARAQAIADRWDDLGHGPAIPSYAAVLLRFDPVALDPESAERTATRIVQSASAGRELSTGRVTLVPTRYDGPDLDDVARLSGLSPREIVELHTSRDHLAYFLGYMPGYAYCAGVDPRIVAPRLPSPRTRVPAGSVGVVDGQTAIYPFTAPGGWRLIGRTDLEVFDPRRDAPALIRPGDRLRFVAA
jgi:KipI family sensor histidine kinase inhibitor